MVVSLCIISDTQCSFGLYNWIFGSFDFVQDNPKFKQAMRIRNPKNRLRKMLDACKNKTKCEGGDEIDVQGQDTEEPVKKSRGGCGAQQPKISIDGKKMVAEYKMQKKRSDDPDPEQMPEPVDRKQQLSAERGMCLFTSGVLICLGRPLIVCIIMTSYCRC